MLRASWGCYKDVAYQRLLYLKNFKILGYDICYILLEIRKFFDQFQVDNFLEI